MKKPLYISALVKEFYAIEAVLALITVNTDNKFEPLRHSHNKWYRDFTSFRDEYIRKLAAAIYDYTVMAVAAEMRHGRKRSSQYILGCYGGCVERNEIYTMCAQYSDRNILRAGARMFDPALVEWHSAYGGEKWKRIMAYVRVTIPRWRQTNVLALILKRT